MRQLPAAGLGLGLVMLLGGCGGGTSVDAGASAPSPNVSAAPSATDSPTPTPSSAPSATPTPTNADDSGPSSSGSTGSGLPGWGTASPNPVTIGAKVVTPRPGMDDVHPVAWSYAELTGKRTVRVYYYAGIEPCTVLDHTSISYGAKAITISLFAGSDPSAGQVACAALARATAVDVTLNQDPAGRTFVDGDTGKPSADSKPAGM